MMATLPVFAARWERHRKRIGIVVLAALLTLGAPFGSAMILMSSPAQRAGFAVRFSWKGIPACGSVSPAFILTGVPPGTNALSFVMHDEDAPDFHHGGATVRYAGGGRIPKGAISYTGPCPPDATSHRYVWTIEARDAAGATIGSTAAAGRYPP